MLGNAVYLGRDRIRPVQKGFAIVSSLLVAIPSLPALTFTPFYLFGWIGGPIACLAYLCSLVNVLRVLYLCATTDPGIIPKIRARSINYQKTYNVTYREPDEISDAL